MSSQHNEHLGDLISALLDGELSGPARVAAEAHLGTCMVCAGEYQATAAIREAVRSLPPVDPPFGVIEAVLVSGRQSRRSRRRPPVWVAGLVAAGSLVILAAVPRHSQSVQPPVATFVDAHAAATPGGDPISGLAPVAVPVSFRSP
jgi:anti-sigma factor RsiW